MSIRPVVLIVLDGYGVAPKEKVTRLRNQPPCF